MKTPKFTETDGGSFTTEWPGDFMAFDGLKLGMELDDMFSGTADIERLRWIELENSPS